jgi:septum formation protein
MTRRLVLASGSPRRRELLSAAGFEFEVSSPSISEISSRGLTLRELTLYNATRKGVAAAARSPGAVILAADTLVALWGRVIGKPADLQDAAATLRRLSGRVHEVCSAVFICEGIRVCCFTEISSVRFRRLSERAISSYLARINPLDKAGAYAAQGHGADIIDRIEGSFTNVVGLPMEKTLRALSYFGIEPAAPIAARRPLDRGARGAEAVTAARRDTKTKR